MKEDGWQCVLGGVGGGSDCNLIEAFRMDVVSVWKYSGKNKVKVVFGLSLPILLSDRFEMDIQNVDIKDYESEFSQSISNISRVTLEISYSNNLQGKLITINYDRTSARRRLLFSEYTSLNNFSSSSSRLLPSI